MQGAVALATVFIQARLLTPTQFGILAMVLPVALVAGMVANRGLHAATLHHTTLTARQLGRLFWIAQRFNAFLLAAMALSAPLLARLYDEPRVVAVTLLWTVGVAFQAAGAFPEAALKRELRLGQYTMLDLMGMVMGSAASVGASLAGWSDVALVLQFVIWNAVRGGAAAIATTFHPGWPGWRLDPDGDLRHLVRYGDAFGSVRLLGWLTRQADRIVVGYASGAAALGLYDGARRWSSYAAQELFLAVNDVAVAALSRVRHDTGRFREYCRRGFTAFLAVPLPLTVFVGAEAELVIRVLLGEAWVSAAPMVRILAAATFADTIARPTTWLFLAEGNAEAQVRWSALSAVLTVITLLVAAPHGAVAVAWASTGLAVALMIPAIIWCLRTSRISVGDYTASVIVPAGAALLALMGWLVIRDWLPVPTPLVPRLLTEGTVFATLVAVSWLIIPGGKRAFHEGIQLLRVLRPARTPTGATRGPTR